MGGRLAAIACAACIASPAVNAQEAVELPKLTVTASRFEASALETPAAVTVADASMIQNATAETVADTLEDMGVLFRSYTGTAGQTLVDLRGFGEGGNLNTLVLVDGRRINNPDMSGINWLDLPLVSVGRVEVLRGAQSALYGDNATGGVIKIETEIPEGTGTAGIAGASSWSGRVARTAGWSEYRGSGALAELGYLEGDGYRANSGYRARIAKAKVESGNEAGGFHWDASMSASDSWMLFPGPLSTTQYEDNPRQSIYDTSYFSDSETYTGTARIGWTGKEVEVAADAAFNARDLDWSMGLPAESRLETANLAPRVRFQFRESMRLILGGDLTADKMDFKRFGDVVREWQLVEAELERVSAGAFAHYLWNVQESFSLTAAARAQFHELEALVNNPQIDASTSGDALAASLGASWLPVKTLRVWARGDRYFRYPALDEVAAFQGYDLTLPFNADLAPEEGWSLETGVDWALPYVLVRAGLFQQWAEGMIAFDYNQNLNVNLSDAERTGFELSTTIVLGEWKLGAQYLQSRIEMKGGPYSGKELYLVPKRQISAYLEWLPTAFLRVRMAFRHVGSSWQGNDYLNEEERVPAYSVMDLTVRLNIMQNLALYGGAENLLNRKYAALRYSGVWYPGAGRSWRAGVQWNF